MGGGMLAGVHVHLAGAAVLVAATGCSTDGDSTTTATQPVPTLAASGCPASDEAFCGTATTAANALATGNTPALFELSRMDSIDSAEVTREYFPQCGSRDVIEGHGLSDAGFIVELAAGDTYRDRLEEITSGVDPAYADQLGNGAVHVLGVGTCGPDVPGRRTYHLAWTAALAEGDESAQRVLGSFEFTFEQDWRIALTYIDTLARWEAEQPDPLEEAFCAAGRTPWA